MFQVAMTTRNTNSFAQARTNGIARIEPIYLAQGVTGPELLQLIRYNFNSSVLSKPLKSASVDMWIKWNVLLVTLASDEEVGVGIPAGCTEANLEEGDVKITDAVPHFYPKLEENLQLSRLEERHNLNRALLHLVKKSHQKGNTITFPIQHRKHRSRQGKCRQATPLNPEKGRLGKFKKRVGTTTTCVAGKPHKPKSEGNHVGLAGNYEESNTVSSAMVSTSKENGFEIDAKLGIPVGKYSVVGWDVDTTGRRLVDEICQIAAFSKDASFSQYVMPYRDLNMAAKRRHNIRVVTIGRYRMLKDSKSGKSVSDAGKFSRYFVHRSERRWHSKDYSTNNILKLLNLLKSVPRRTFLASSLFLFNSIWIVAVGPQHHQHYLDQLINKLQYRRVKPSTVNPYRRVKSSTVNPYRRVKLSTVNPYSRVKSSTVNPYSRVKSSTVNPYSRVKSSTVNPYRRVKSSTVNPYRRVKSSTVNPYRRVKSSTVNPYRRVKSSTVNPYRRVKSSTVNPYRRVKSSTVNPYR
uniref:Exuperantia RNAse H-like domain-containing protein n=1 Tax=Timema tahoe TaxID=61484 RepID=A0A7R9IPU5_9NEOP|nr:unnamed protein product [Timema tahoe]